MRPANATAGRIDAPANSLRPDGGAGSALAPAGATAGRIDAPADPLLLGANADPAPAPTAVDATIDAEGWPQLVEAAGLSGMPRQFALNCVPAAFEADILHLRVDPAAADRRTRQIEERLVRALSRHLQRDIRVVFDVTPAALATPARQRALAEQDRVTAAAAAFADDPAVKGLRERFGGQIDCASIKPGN